jgi:ribosomal protein S18 acetylase RimI-like enzyme
MNTLPIRISGAETAADVEDARILFLEYAASLDIDLGFQGFNAEQATLPGRYAPPAGALYLARTSDDASLGVVAVRPFDAPRACEIKRLYVRPEGRGSGTGRLLMARAIEFARQAGYAEILLDTLPSMTVAMGLYTSLGFREVAPYSNNALPGTLFFSLRL